MRNKLFLIFLGLIGSTELFAQENTVAMADVMRSEGKIYVVVAVILTIFIGIVLYLVRLDLKITKLEKEIKES